MGNSLDYVCRDAIWKLKTAKGDLNQLADAGITIMRLCNIVRREGLLALEEEAEKTASDFLKSLLMVLVDGTDPELVVEIATNGYWMNALEDADAMRDYIYIRGVLCIQAGEAPELTEIILRSLMPAQQGKIFHEKIEEADRESKMRHEKAVAAEFSNIFVGRWDIETTEQVLVLEKSLLSCSDRTLQRIVRDIDNHDMAVCIYAFREDMRIRVLDNVTERYKTLLMELVVKLAPIPYEDVDESIAKVQSIIKKLRESGEIC